MSSVSLTRQVLKLMEFTCFYQKMIMWRRTHTQNVKRFTDASSTQANGIYLFLPKNDHVTPHTHTQHVKRFTDPSSTQANGLYLFLPKNDHVTPHTHTHSMSSVSLTRQVLKLMDFTCFYHRWSCDLPQTVKFFFPGSSSPQPNHGPDLFLHTNDHGTLNRKWRGVSLPEFRQLWLREGFGTEITTNHLRFVQFKLLRARDPCTTARKRSDPLSVVKRPNVWRSCSYIPCPLCNFLLDENDPW